MNELQFPESVIFKRFFSRGGATVAFQDSLSFSAALELGCSLQIQLIFGFFVQHFTVFLRAEAGKERSHTGPAHLNSSTIFLTLALLQASPSPSGRVVLPAGTPRIPPSLGSSPPSVLLLFVSSPSAARQFLLLLAALTGVAGCGFYLSPG